MKTSEKDFGKRSEDYRRNLQFAHLFADVDTCTSRADHLSMNDITRHEIDARLEALETRLDARVQNIENAVVGFKDEARQLRTELSHAKWWAIGTAVAVLSIFAGVLQWGLQSQRDENARFSSYLRDDVKAAAVQNQQLLNDAKVLFEQIKAQQAPPTAAPQQ
ncbi:hypothetical protein [Stutzerimonas stutzeri]|uniref:hypothetical protein n=1 Tax=Stutzerimonas stutzeri TaxID=316 RepID=UPI000F78B7CC|nr:hypothetical protein [Stutzerimonas stutzeri]RRV80381.1 hypothetical protein EGI92_12410 [Stutzerimonas stutzeri]